MTAKYYGNLADTSPVAMIGNKFANLCRIANTVSVPPAICITVQCFLEAMDAKKLTFLEEFFADLHATVGCFLLETIPGLNQELEDLSLSPAQQQSLRDYMIETMGVDFEEEAFAVRSSGIAEDSVAFSFAGVYQTMLNVRGFAALCDAVAQCWQAYYSYAAIAARIRANQYDHMPAMAVIVQKMVPAEFAGVAFSAHDNDGVIVEYVEGLGENLVSGIIPPKRCDTCDLDRLPGKEKQIIEEVQMAARKLQHLFKYPIDMEWAWYEQQVSVLQARPITAQLKQQHDVLAPLFRYAHLYLETNLPPDFDLGECRDVYISYVSKRAHAFQIAAASHIAIGSAYILSFNGPGLMTQRDQFMALLAANPTPQIVIDLNTNIRQVILYKEDAFDYLVKTFNMSSTSMSSHTIIIRDFIRGSYGFISRLTGHHELLIEYSPDGLLNINRGIAHCHRIMVHDTHLPLMGENISVEKPADLDLFVAALPQINDLTRALNTDMAGAQLEWVLEQNTPYFVDYSQELAQITTLQVDKTVIISPGTTRGPIYLLYNDEMLARLSTGPAISVHKNRTMQEHQGLSELITGITACSQKPIIYARLPYAILSVLFEHVAGFIFAEGSLLCHLAILLRETTIPAVICPDQTFEQNSEIILANGHITLLQDTSK
jgi:hypothetical protein